MIDQPGDFDHRRDGADLTEHGAMRAADRFPIVDIGHEDARADDVLELGADCPQRRRDVGQRLLGLSAGITRADDSAGRVRGRGARDIDKLPDAYGP